MNIMMILGVFPFMTDTMAYEKLERSFEYKWAEQERLPHPVMKYLGIGGPALQYMGPGTQTVSLNGAIYPGQQGMKLSLVALRLMAGTGKPFLMLTTEGKIMGWWAIKKIDETSSEYKKYILGATPRKVEFSLSLQRFVDFEKDAITLLS